ncbi:MAG: Wzz/FepE/Etk N-terminal domain-containing protein [Bacteroidota bacterium]
MTDTNSSESRPILRSVYVLLRHWKFLTAAFFTAAVVALVYALMLPNWYRSDATFLPPQGNSSLLEGVTGGLSTTLKSFGIGGLGGSGDGYSYIAILESRRMGEILIKEFDLVKVYDIPDGSMEKTLKALSENSAFSYEEDGRVVISVWDTQPKRAAGIADAYFTHLNEIATELNSNEARDNREFVELQYNGIRDSLTKLENRMAVFQKRTKIYSLPEQTKATIAAAGEMYAVLKMQEAKLGVMERKMGPDDADVRSQRQLVQELSKHVPGLGDNELTGLLGDKGTDLPEEGLTYLRLYRDIEILSKLQGFLLPMYQQSIIEEQKKMHVLVPLDRAHLPERKDRPKRSIIILAAGFSLLALAMAFLLLRERFRYYAQAYPDEWASVRRNMGFKRGAE